MEYTHVIHTFGPVYDQNAVVLVLGSFPSVKSREQQFYYGHPQNRFWKVMAGCLEKEVPVTVEEKRRFLLEERIALWDVIAECDIAGSSDSSIRNAVPNKIEHILESADIRGIFANGKKAYQLYQKYGPKEGTPLVYELPSTSPANASFSLERLIESWKAAFAKIEQLEIAGNGV